MLEQNRLSTATEVDVATIKSESRNQENGAADSPPEFAFELKRTARRLARQGKWDEARNLYYYVVELTERLFGPKSTECHEARQMFEPLYQVDKLGVETHPLAN